MRNIICIFFDHKIPEGYSEFIHLGCTKWDNCNIKEHQIVDMIYKCERCDFKITKRVRLYELEHNITILTESEGKN